MVSFFCSGVLAEIYSALSAVYFGYCCFSAADGFSGFGLGSFTGALFLTGGNIIFGFCETGLAVMLAVFGSTGVTSFLCGISALTGSTCFVCCTFVMFRVGYMVTMLGWTGMPKIIGGATSSSTAFGSGFTFLTGDTSVLSTLGSLGSGTCISFTGCLIVSYGQLKSVLFSDTTSKSYG